ncbi:MAG: protease modulator HflC [candidate division NC10 bacterium]|nr:protease modulator HflC [Candidatus Rokubacteria bacterium]MBI4390350.1 protease modulator HflC [candidate division NC10 bacterium]
MRRLFTRTGLVLLVGGVLVLSQTLFTVGEWEQALIIQLGEHRRTIREPGLHWKLPLAQQITKIERRILSSDADPAEYLTLDKKRMLVNHVTRWRITDPLRFFKTVRDEAGARARLDDLVFSELRREIASRDFAELIAAHREPAMEAVASRTAEKARQFGIDVVDVRVKRADLPTEVQASVFARMVAERERIAKRYRSEGAEESAKIRAETDKEKTIILARAYEESQRRRGEGDAQATRLYGSAFGQDPEFYGFVRSLEAYEKFLGEKSTVFLSPDSRLLRYLRESRRPE